MSPGRSQSAYAMFAAVAEKLKRTRSSVAPSVAKGIATAQALGSRDRPRNAGTPHRRRESENRRMFFNKKSSMPDSLSTKCASPIFWTRPQASTDFWPTKTLKADATAEGVTASTQNPARPMTP